MRRRVRRNRSRFSRNSSAARRGSRWRGGWRAVANRLGLGARDQGQRGSLRRSESSVATRLPRPPSQVQARRRVQGMWRRLAEISIHSTARTRRQPIASRSMPRSPATAHRPSSGCRHSSRLLRHAAAGVKQLETGRMASGISRSSPRPIASASPSARVSRPRAPLRRRAAAWAVRAMYRSSGIEDDQEPHHEFGAHFDAGLQLGLAQLSDHPQVGDAEQGGGDVGQHRGQSDGPNCPVQPVAFVLVQTPSPDSPPPRPLAKGCESLSRGKLHEILRRHRRHE